MTWKTAYRSLYYQGAPEPDDPVLVPSETALLVIDIQKSISNARIALRCRPKSSTAMICGRHFTIVCKSRSFPTPQKC